MTRHAAIAAAFAGAGLVGFVTGAQAATTTHLTIEGTKQGIFKGDCAGDASKQKICALAFHFGVHVPTASTGLVTGKRQYDALVITKSVGDSSVQEFQALVTSEAIKTVTLEVLQTNPDGTQTVAYRIKLTNAFVTSLTQAEEPGAGATATAATENVAFSFQRITVESPRLSATDTGR
jgi:type VI secretion system secreted protein Hcp